jgi:hypothetical protein
VIPAGYDNIVEINPSNDSISYYGSLGTNTWKWGN